MYVATDMQFRSPFDPPPPSIPPDCEVVFVADVFASDYVGGAELTTEAIIDSSPYKVHRVRCRELTPDYILNGKHAHWIFGNFSMLPSQLLPLIISNLSYSIIEYDYKYCEHRSPELHKATTGAECDCSNRSSGMFVSMFMGSARSLWWMSEKQKQRYHALFPSLASKTNVVLSSVFTDETLNDLKQLRSERDAKLHTRWITLRSPSWVKGAQAAAEYCDQNQLEYVQIWNESYDNVLDMMSRSRGFVYLPAGADTCPRMVIEAKLLGCELVLNDHVQHKDEEWFATDDLDSIDEYLRASKTLFWNGIRHAIEQKPLISGYVTTHNCIQQRYPFIECIKSLQAFCFEVCVVDGGSHDGTLEELVKLARPEVGDRLDECVERLRAGNEEFVGNGLRVKVVRRNWKDPRFALFDGMQKAAARGMCTGEFCWQMDSDEIVHEDDAHKIAMICQTFHPQADIISLPVIEYWGSRGKVRVDVNPWKWRLSRNLPHITHGVPQALRRYDDEGRLFAAPGTDGCDMIHTTTGEPLTHLSFYTPEAHSTRVAALSGHPEALAMYEAWFNQIVATLPGVHHYSWYDIGRKMRLYRNYWQAHWSSLTNANVSDSVENNMMFDLAWKDVTEQMIDERADEFERRLGGWIFHTKVDFSRCTPWIAVKRSQPKIMQSEAV